MTLKTSTRGAVPPFIVMDVMREANKLDAVAAENGTPGVIHLEVGQPSSAAPEAVRATAKAALDQERLGYTDAFGLPALRDAIAEHYRDYYGVAVDPARVVATTGSSGAFVLAFLAAFDAGDRVALASPGYPAYRNILRALGVDVVDIPVGPESNYQPTPEHLDAVEGDLAGLILASPSNPTGTMVSRDELRDLCVYCESRGVRLISDEIYHGITYEARADTALEFTDEAVIVNSFSKYFSMTGWRLGWMVVPGDIMRAVECLAQNLFISPPTLSQVAAVSVFACEDALDANVARYAANRAVLLEGLPKLGFDKLSHADGAFYVYADVTEMTDDSTEFCRRMLKEAGVAATPGIDFDPSRGNRFVRFSFAGSTDDMEEALRRLAAWCG
jgi:aspartate/methionine/tyrosine aminotransferase